MLMMGLRGFPPKPSTPTQFRRGEVPPVNQTLLKTHSMLDLTKVSASVKAYGTPLWNEITLIGTLKTSELDIVNGVFQYGPYYIRVRKSAMDAGLGDTVQVAEFQASRDYHEGDIHVEQGKCILMAY